VTERMRKSVDVEREMRVNEGVSELMMGSPHISVSKANKICT